MKDKIIRKEQLRQAAYDLVDQEGFLVFSARNIAKHAGCSTQPIYSAYESLDELKKDVVVKVLDDMIHHMINYNHSNEPFYDYALGYLEFVSHHNHLFKLLHLENKLNVFFINPQVYAILKQATQITFDLNDQQSGNILKRLWLVVQGIAIQISNGQYEWYVDRQYRILKETFKAFI